MAKIVRYNGNLIPFASASLGTERTIFGEVTQADDISSQYTAEFLRGWGIVGPSDQPTLQDFNAVSYTHGQILSYLHQVGVAEYNSAQEYHIGSLANAGGTLYVSLIDSNVGNQPESSPASWELLNASINIVGETKNARCSIVAASASSTFAADQVIVSESLSGKSYRLSTFSKVINLATTGAGGMDTGAAPVNGYVAIYAIYDPDTNTSALLGKNATLAEQTEIYSGVNMPSGYTASALIGVLPTNGSGQFSIASMKGRKVSFEPVNVLTSVLNQPTFTSLSIAGAVPFNAKYASGTLLGASTTTTAIAIQVASTAGGLDAQQGSNSSVISLGVPFREMDILTPQTIYRINTVGTGTPSFSINVTNYRF